MKNILTMGTKKYISNVYTYPRLYLDLPPHEIKFKNVQSNRAISYIN